MSGQLDNVRTLIRKVDGDVQSVLDSLWQQVDHLPSMTRMGKLQAVLAQSWRSVRAAPYTFLATIATASLTFTLVAVFALIVSNLSDSLISSQSSLNVRIFLRSDVALASTEDLQQQLKELPSVASLSVVSADQAFQEFEKILGVDAALLDGLEREHPLPASLELQLERGGDAHTLAETIKALPEVTSVAEYIYYPEQAALRMAELVALGRSATILLSLGLLLVAALLIGNACKLALHSHRDEVEILALMGASAPRIMTPYVIEGVVQGLIGAAIGCFLTYLGYLLVADLVASTQFMSLLMPSFSFLSTFFVVLLLLIGAGVAGIGSYLSVRGMAREHI